MMIQRGEVIETNQANFNSLIESELVGKENCATKNSLLTRISIVEEDSAILEAEFLDGVNNEKENEAC